MINTIIVDDEPLAREIIEAHVGNIPDLNLIASCSNAIEANKVLNENDVDLMFLDIQMPQLTGMEFLRSLSNPPMTIFTTAYAEHAVDGFELDAVDYLLKPISFERFLKATNKVIEKVKKDSSSSGSELGVEEDFFFVKSDKKMMKVFYKDILYIEGLKDYVIIRLEEGRVITLQTMKSLEVKLPSEMFKRIHRSYILNLTKLRAIEGNMVELEEKGQKKMIPIGKNYRDELTKLVISKKL
ncbi:MAG: DNA-binding LytR/AlgR family response regulator [Saprospiraceae bacterium]|jgi:DNA-binding LytR/AlgR family response regulator